MNNFGIPWKSLVAFLGVFAGQLWARAVVNGIPVLPTSPSGWLALLGGSFIAAVGVWLKGNVYTVAQAEKKVVKAKARRAKARQSGPGTGTIAGQPGGPVV